jgi:hypothetical protein
MSTATEVVEEVTEVTATATAEPKRGRKKGLKLVNADKTYPTKENAKENEPYYAKEKTRTIKNEKGENIEEEYLDHDDIEDAEGLRLYQLTDMRTNEVKFALGRNNADALATFAGEFTNVELLDAQPRGRQKKLDPIYIMFFKSMLDQNKNAELIETLKAQDLMHYLPTLQIDEAGNKIAA